MADQQTIEDMFEALEVAGYKRPGAWDSPKKVEMGIRVYAMVFRDVSNEDAHAAALAFVESGEKFWPQPGVLKGYTKSARLDEVDTAEDAWGLVNAALSRRGRLHPPGDGWDFDGTDIHRAACRSGILAAGGWSALCDTDTDQMAPNRASFRKAYQAAIQRKQVTEQYESITTFLGSKPRLMLAD